MFVSLHIPSILNRSVSEVSCVLSGIAVGQSLTFPHGLSHIWGKREDNDYCAQPCHMYNLGKALGFSEINVLSGNFIQSVDVYEASVTVCFQCYNRSVFLEFLI